MTKRAGNMVDADDFKNELALMKEKYPFMDTVLLSRRSGPDRDLAYAYNVLGRIPPGQAGDLFKMVGVQPELVESFYNNKGDMSAWAEGDRALFMAAMINLGAISAMPNLPTRQEWNQTRSQYADMKGEIEKQYGKDIYERINEFHAANEKSSQAGQAYLKTNPDVQMAMDTQTAYIVSNPLLNTHYGGIDTIARFYASEARGQLRAKYGENVYETYYSYLDILDPQDKKAFYNAHPELKGFIKDKNDFQDVINKQTAALAATLPNLNLPQRTFASPTQNFLAGQLDTPNPNPEIAQAIQSQMSEELTALVSLHIQTGAKLSYPAEQALTFIARRYGMTADQALQILMAYGG
jgi:hypothetical protein